MPHIEILNNVIKTEHIDILNSIIETEQKAQEIANSAKRQLDGLSEGLKDELAQLREGYMKRAQKHIDELAEQEDAAAARVIAELDERLPAETDAFKRLSEEKHDEWVGRLFNFVMAV